MKELLDIIPNADIVKAEARPINYKKNKDQIVKIVRRIEEAVKRGNDTAHFGDMYIDDFIKDLFREKGYTWGREIAGDGHCYYDVIKLAGR
jgi:hypothetical protein